MINIKDIDIGELLIWNPNRTDSEVMYVVKLLNHNRRVFCTVVTWNQIKINQCYYTKTLQLSSCCILKKSKKNDK